MKIIPSKDWAELSPEEKQRVHEAHVAEATAHLETLMGEAGLPEESKRRLRRAFPGTDKGGMRQAVILERRMVVTQ
jgi:hypothetical protein